MAFAHERSSGDLTRSFVGGTMQQVDDVKSKDGCVCLFVAADWADLPLDIKPFEVSKNNKIPVYCQVQENLLMCSCIIIMQGKQCGPLHLALVAHCREWLWSKTTPAMSRREVEGSGIVDYLSIMWAIDSGFSLYSNVTNSVGMRLYNAPSGGSWDGFWYIYLRGNSTPAYSHIGLDTSATLNNQKHVLQAVKDCIDQAAELADKLPPTTSPKQGSIVGRLFGRRASSANGGS